MLYATRRRASTLRRLLDVFALLAGVVALAASVWIVVPAPHYNIWLVSVVASEWSLWLGALGAICVVYIFATGRRQGGVWVRRFAFICGSLAVVFALVPPASMLLVARERGAELSLREYFAGSPEDESSEANDSTTHTFTTHTFATVANTTLRLDAYLPARQVKANGAGVIVVHGGSWSAGERNDFPVWNRWLANQGYAVFDIDYRIAPQPNWREATGDVRCAVAWIKQQAPRFGVDPARLAIMGRSAGGHLALLAAYAADDTRIASSCGGDGGGGGGGGGAASDARVRLAAALYAPTDLLWAYDNTANELVLDGQAKLRGFLGGNPHSDNSELRSRYRLLSPIAHVSRATPPTLLVHSGQDQLVRPENMTLLAAELQRAGVAHETLLIPYAQHGFDYNFHGFGAQVTRHALLNFLQRHLNTAAQESSVVDND